MANRLVRGLGQTRVVKGNEVSNRKPLWRRFSKRLTTIKSASAQIDLPVNQTANRKKWLFLHIFRIGPGIRQYQAENIFGVLWQPHISFLLTVEIFKNISALPTNL